MLRRIFITLGYVSVALVVAALTVVLVAYGKGYSYDFSTGQIVRNGLLILSSQPSGGMVTINGRDIHRRTSYHATLRTGSYDITVSKTGFQTWHKRVTMVASQVTFAEYVLLIPDSLSQQEALTASQISNVTSSTDHHKIAYLEQKSDQTAIMTADSTGKNQVTAYKLPPTGDPATAQHLVGMIWSDDDSHLLVAVQTAAGRQYLVVTADGSSEPVNLTTKLQFDFDGGLNFAPGAWQQLYWNSPEGLRRIDIGNQSVSGVLDGPAAEIVRTSDHLYYVETSSIGRSLWSIDRSGHRQQAVQTLPQSDSYAVAESSYHGHDLLAVVPAATRTATLYIDPSSANATARIISRDADAVSFSPESRYLIAYSATGATTYDFDRTDATGKAVMYQPSLGGITGSISWLDPYHFLYTAGGSVKLSEFDGGNVTTLASGAGAGVFASSDDHTLVFVRHNTSINQDSLITISLR